MPVTVRRAKTFDRSVPSEAAPYDPSVNGLTFNARDIDKKLYGVVYRN